MGIICLFSSSRSETKAQTITRMFKRARCTMHRVSHIFCRVTFSLFIALFSIGCAPTRSPAGTSAPITLNIFAAASLTEAFTEIGRAFTAANPGVDVVFNFAGSNQLATQIAAGAPADVFASASPIQMSTLMDTGQVSRGTPRTFARNRLVVITPRENRAQLTTLADLAEPGIAIVFAAREVPVGQYTLDFLDKTAADPTLGEGYREAVLANLVSYEQNVRAVLAKVSLGEADAGIVYTSDVGAAAHQITQIEIPDHLNTVAAYPIAALHASANPSLAQQFVDYVLSPQGQEVLRNYGFIGVGDN